MSAPAESRGRVWGVVLLAAVLSGCARYAPVPLAPAETAARLEGRRLDDPGLAKFIGEQSGGKPGSTEAWNLDTLTLAAFYFHPDLKVARAQWELAAGGVRTAAARPNPSITAAPSYDSGIPGNYSPWLVPVTLDIPIETMGKRGKRMAEAAKLEEAARWDYASALWKVRSGVRSGVEEAGATERKAKLLADRVAIQGKLVERLRQRFAAGDLARPELTAAEIVLNQAKMDLAGAEVLRLQARAQLAQAVGVPVVALAGVRMDLDLPEGSPEELMAAEPRRQALRARADILASLAEYAAAEAELSLQVAKQYPDLHLGPGYAWNNGNAGDSQWTLGLTLELPVLDQNQGPIAEALAKRKLAAAKFEALQAQVIAEIDRAAAGLGAAKRQFDGGKALLGQAARQEESVAKQVRAGVATEADLLAVRMETNSLQLAQLEAEAQYEAAIGALEDALQLPPEVAAQVQQQAARELKGTKP